MLTHRQYCHEKPVILHIVHNQMFSWTLTLLVSFNKFKKACICINYGNIISQQVPQYHFIIFVDRYYIIYTHFKPIGTINRVRKGDLYYAKLITVKRCIWLNRLKGKRWDLVSFHIFLYIIPQFLPLMSSLFYPFPHNPLEHNTYYIHVHVG